MWCIHLSPAKGPCVKNLIQPLTYSWLHLEGWHTPCVNLLVGFKFDIMNKRWCTVSWLGYILSWTPCLCFLGTICFPYPTLLLPSACRIPNHVSRVSWSQTKIMSSLVLPPRSGFSQVLVFVMIWLTYHGGVADHEVRAGTPHLPATDFTLSSVSSSHGFAS